MREIAMHRFLIVIERAGSNFSAYSPDLPGCREFLLNSWLILGAADRCPAYPARAAGTLLVLLSAPPSRSSSASS
jgi:hypothetical protein